MAGPITHITLTEKIYETYFKNRDKRAFFVGTCFPDIRYLGSIKRGITHFDNLRITDLNNDNDFIAGLKMHSIIDSTRENYVVDNEIYSLCPSSDYITQSLKILEDQLLYDQIKNWPEYISYLDTILPDQMQFGIKKKDINKWHRILHDYFSQKPDSNIISNLARDIGFSKDAIREINKNIQTMKANKKIIFIIKNLYDNFENIIKTDA